VAGLKAEVEQLTVSHDLEVERLQERLGQLQTVQDKLELALRAKLPCPDLVWLDLRRDGDPISENAKEHLRDCLYERHDRGSETMVTCDWDGDSL
jgi:hypothetical protein